MIGTAFSLYVDASNLGAGVVLLQADGGVEHPVSYFSRKFNSYQLNYSVGEKEALALTLLSCTPCFAQIAGLDAGVCSCRRSIWMYDM